MVDFFNAHSYFIAQVFGFSAMFTAILMYQFKKHRTIMFLMMLSSALWCLHFACLGLVTPILMNFLNVVRAVVFSFREKGRANNILIPVLFCVAAVVLMFCTWTGPVCLLPGISSIFATAAGWQKNTKKLKILTVPCCAGWFTYNLLNGSVAGMCNEALVFFSIIVFFVRNKRDITV